MTDPSRRGQDVGVLDRPPGAGSDDCRARPGAIDGSPAFEALFLAHYEFVWRALAYFGVSASALDDATQDVFMIVYRRLSDFDGRAPLRSWLRGIARRVARDHRRSTVRTERKLQAVAQAREELPLADTLRHAEAVRIVDGVLAELGPIHREVFLLAELEDMSAPEISEILGIKLNTVYSRLRTARERLRRAVDRIAPARGSDE